MNRRFHEIARQQNNVNVDRSFFNANTRQDKNWQQQSQKPQHKLNKNDINADRAFFNINTNEAYNYIDKNRQIADRNFNQYLYANSMKNKNIYENDGYRIKQNNTRNYKNNLDTEKNNFVNRTVNTNPYAKNINVGVTRIQAIDSKNNDHNMYKQQASSNKAKKNKFNPFAIY